MHLEQDIPQIIGKKLDRLVRNITKTTVHVSSAHRLTEKEVAEVEIVASALGEMSDPCAVAQKVAETRRSHPDYLEYSCLYIAMRNLVRDALNKKGGFDADFKVHQFLEVVAGTSAGAAAVSLGLVKDERFESFEMTHDLDPDLIGSRKIIGVCAAPQLARTWIKAAEQAMLHVYPELNSSIEAENCKQV